MEFYIAFDKDKYPQLKSLSTQEIFIEDGMGGMHVKEESTIEFKTLDELLNWVKELKCEVTIGYDGYVGHHDDAPYLKVDNYDFWHGRDEGV